jgi:hypothetical protein
VRADVLPLLHARIFLGIGVKVDAVHPVPKGLVRRDQRLAYRVALVIDILPHEPDQGGVRRKLHLCLVVVEQGPNPVSARVLLRCGVRSQEPSRPSEARGARPASFSVQRP